MPAMAAQGSLSSEIPIFSISKLETAMPSFRTYFVSCLAALLVTGPATAQDAPAVAKDVFATGANAAIDRPADRDAFVSGFSVSLDSEVGKDAHAAGFNVSSDALVGGDLYAFGATVNIGSPVGEDITASGFSVRLRSDAEIGGNARLSGATIQIDGPVKGNLAALAGALEINSEINGDAMLSAGDLEFGPNARVGGMLTYSAPSRIDIPDSVATPDRVRFERLSLPKTAGDISDTARDSIWRFWPSFFGIVAGFIIALLFLVAVAALLLAFAPQTAENWRLRASERMWVSILFGGAGLAFLIGLVPVSGMTIIGAPLIPIVLFGVFALWVLGYLVGAYALGWRVTGGFRELPDTMTGRLVLVAITLVILAILNFIPLLGWLLNFAVVLLGIGALTTIAGERVFCRASSGGESTNQEVTSVDAETGEAPAAGEAKPAES
jgi:hypothetical protein